MCGFCGPNDFAVEPPFHLLENVLHSHWPALAVQWPTFGENISMGEVVHRSILTPVYCLEIILVVKNHCRL